MGKKFVNDCGFFAVLRFRRVNSKKHFLQNAAIFKTRLIRNYFRSDSLIQDFHASKMSIWNAKIDRILNFSNFLGKNYLK